MTSLFIYLFSVEKLSSVPKLYFMFNIASSKLNYLSKAKFSLKKRKEKISWKATNYYKNSACAKKFGVTCKEIESFKLFQLLNFA